VSRAFTRSIYLYSVGLDLASMDAWTRASFSASRGLKILAGTSRRPSPLFLLSTFPSPSRCQSGNVAALSSQGHFFVGAVCLF